MLSEQTYSIQYEDNNELFSVVDYTLCLAFDMAPFFPVYLLTRVSSICWQKLCSKNEVNRRPQSKLLSRRSFETTALRKDLLEP